MKTSECVYCKRMFECKGKETDEPCVCFEDRRKERDKVQEQEDRGERD